MIERQTLDPLPVSTGPTRTLRIVRPEFPSVSYRMARLRRETQDRVDQRERQDAVQAAEPVQKVIGSVIPLEGRRPISTHAEAEGVGLRVALDEKIRKPYASTVRARQFLGLSPDAQQEAEATLRSEIKKIEDMIAGGSRRNEAADLLNDQAGNPFLPNISWDSLWLRAHGHEDPTD